jgi:hypothetical protein
VCIFLSLLVLVLEFLSYVFERLSVLVLVLHDCITDYCYYEYCPGGLGRVLV